MANISSEIEERINSLLDPVQFGDEIEQRVEFEMCPNTANWVLTNDDYVKWRREKTCGVLWIHGSPGSGKSFLTLFILNQLSTGTFLGHSGVAYFASDRIVRSKPRSTASVLYNAIIAQLLLQLATRDEGAVSRILADLEACQAVDQFTTPFRLWKNLQLATSAFKSCFVLIDGLDENKEWQDVLALLKRIVSESQGRVKLLVSSRSWDTIRELIHNNSKDAAAVIQLTKDLMTSDIKAFVTWKIKDLDTRDLEGGQNVLEGLVAGADGLMLLAKYRAEALMRQTRQGKTNLDQVLKALPREVNDYYSQSISLIKGLPGQERGVATQVFVWVTFASRILTFQELSEALLFRRTGRAASKSPVITRRSLDNLCQGLIVLRNDAVEVSHGSVFHYLLKEGLPSMTDSYDKEHNAFDHTLVEAELAGTLLDYLCSCPNPDLENGKTWSWADARDYPLLDYSLNCWPPHTFAAKRIIPAAFEKFMQSPQHRHWWQCWSQNVDARGNLELYSALQALFHSWLDSFHPLEAKKIVNIAGPILPLRMLEEKLDMQELHPRENRERILHTLTLLSQCYIDNNQWNAGLIAGERALSMSSELTKRTSTVHGVVARIHGMRGDLHKEVAMKEQLLNFLRSQYGPHHVQTIVALDNIALAYQRLGQHQKANEHSVEALKLAKDLFGEDHPETVQVIANRAVILLDVGGLDEALPLAATASEMISLTRGCGHQFAIVAKDNLAQILYARGEEKEGRKLRLEAFSMALVSLGHDHLTTQEIFSGLEQEFYRKGDLKALATLREYKMLYYVSIYGEDDPRTLEMMNKMLLVYMSGEDWESARTIGERLVKALQHQKYDVDEGNLWRAAIQKLSKVYDFFGEYEKGIVLGEETLSFYLERNSLETDFGLAAARDLSRMYHRVEDWPNAIRCGSLAVEVATNVKGKDSKEAITFKRELAIAFWGAKQYQAGFYLDTENFDTCTRVYGAVHPTTVEALLTVCEALRPCKQKDLVLHFYELLLLTQRLSNESRSPNHSNSAAIQSGLDELFRRVPEEWHPDMLAIQDVSHTPSLLFQAPNKTYRTKHISTTSLVANRTLPTNEANASGLSEPPPSVPDTEDQNCRQKKPGESASHDVLLAYSNAMFHHFGLTAFSIPSGEIEEARIEEVVEEEEL